MHGYGVYLYTKVYIQLKQICFIILVPGELVQHYDRFFFLLFTHPLAVGNDAEQT